MMFPTSSGLSGRGFESHSRQQFFFFSSSHNELSAPKFIPDFTLPTDGVWYDDSRPFPSVDPVKNVILSQ